MPLRDVPIRTKLMTVNLATSAVVLVLTCTAFVGYEFLTFRQEAVANITTLGRVIAANSTAAVAFDNKLDAVEVLSALKAEPQIVVASLYDADGRLFATYPANLPPETLPAAPPSDGSRFEGVSLMGVQPVVQGDSQRLGTLYLVLDLSVLHERLRLYGGIAALLLLGSFLLAYLISRALQRQISGPILALAETARAVSDRGDYSVRATPSGSREIGILTGAFNHMLTQIQSQDGALRESEARVRSVLNSALSAVVVIDACGRIEEWNAQAEQMFGWTRAEALGVELAECIIPSRHRDAHRRGLERYLGTGEGEVFDRLLEMSALRRDGSEFPVELTVSALKTDHTITFCGFVTDITERKLAESKLRAQLSRLDLLHRITAAIGERQDLPSILHVVLDAIEADLPVDFACACRYDALLGVLTVAGLGSRSRALAAALEMADETPIPLDENGLARCARGEVVYEPAIDRVPFPFPRRLAGAGLRSLVVAPLRVESEVFGILVAARRREQGFSSADCEFLRQLSGHVALALHQSKLYVALQEAYDDLRRTQQAVMQQERLRALGQMASGIAHDINNAISPVALYTESLLEKEKGLSPKARDYLQTIQHAVEGVAQTVSRMREFYRQREPQLNLAAVDLNRVVEQATELTRAKWSDMPQQRGVVIELHKELGEGLPPVMGVESEIREALTNLIFNAVDAMPEGGTLTVRSCTRGYNGDAQAQGQPPPVAVEIIDSGAGMDEETRRNCLEPFYTTKGERGTGLGLAMVYGTVQRHSADIEIESELGRGTCVRLLFPVPTTLARLPEPATAPRPRRLRLLIVDDDPLLTRSLRDTLEGDGHSVTVAPGGQEGIDAFRDSQARNQPFAVVITDLGMPHVDGRKVAEAVHHLSSATPVVLLTGWGQRLVADGDIPPYVSFVLNKPPRLQELRRALAQCCAEPAHAEVDRHIV